MICLAILLASSFYIPRTFPISDSDIVVNIAEEINEHDNHGSYLTIMAKTPKERKEHIRITKPQINHNEGLKSILYRDIPTLPPEPLG